LAEHNRRTTALLKIFFDVFTPVRSLFLWHVRFLENNLLILLLIAIGLVVLFEKNHPGQTISVKDRLQDGQFAGVRIEHPGPGKHEAFVPTCGKECRHNFYIPQLA
jgi:hypothetical protein